MQVKELTSSLQGTSSVLLENIRDQFNQRVTVPLSNLDEEFVTGLTGIYQQTLKENGLEDGIEAEGTINVLGYEQDISISWSPDVLLSPDLVHWAQGRSEELRNRINYTLSLLIVLYNEVLRQFRNFVEDRIEDVRSRFEIIDEATDRLGDLADTVDSLRNQPVKTVQSLFG